MKKVFLILFFILCSFYVYSLGMNDFSLISSNKNQTIKITEDKEKILQIFNGNKIQKREIDNSCENYIVDDIDFTFLGSKIISIVLQNKKYYLPTKVKIGDNINKIIKNYGNPDYQGEFADGYLFFDYYLKLETSSPWKEPQYTMRFIYIKNKINKIVFFYTE